MAERGLSTTSTHSQTAPEIPLHHEPSPTKDLQTTAADSEPPQVRPTCRWPSRKSTSASACDGPGRNSLTDEGACTSSVWLIAHANALCYCCCAKDKAQ